MNQKNYSDDVVKEWFNQLPERWSLQRLRTLGRFTSSGIDKKNIEGEPLVSMVNYTDVYGNSSLELRNSPDYMVVSCPVNRSEEHGLEQGDMLFTPSSETPEDIGVSAVVMEDLFNTVYSYHIIRFRMHDKVSLYYRKYLCNHPKVLRQFTRLCKGTTRQILVREDFKSVWVAIPPKEQQDRIAIYLDEQTGKIDGLIERRRRQMVLLKEQRTALIQETITRGLNPNAPMKDSGLSWLGEIPAHWKVIQVRRLLSFVTSGARGWAECERTRLAQNDVLVCVTGALTGNVSFVDFEPTTAYVNQHVAILRPKENLVMPKFIATALWSDQGRVQFKLAEYGGTKQGLNFDDLRFALIALSPKNEQAEILNFIQLETTKIDRIYASYARQLTLLTEYRAALIHECVTGQRTLGTEPHEI